MRVNDPLAEIEEARTEYGLTLTPMDKIPPADALIVAVAYGRFRQLGLDTIRSLVRPDHLVIDIKGILDRTSLEANGFRVWRL